jgi:uncharacterized membrane protein
VAPLTQIILWAVLFVGTHLVFSYEPVRQRIVGRLGLQPFRAVYSLIAFATFLPMAVVFARNKHAGPMLWYLRLTDPVRWLTWFMMAAALILLTASVISPGPATIGARPIDHPVGVLKITRHPAFVAFSLFGFGHMLMNGWAGDLIFFGTFPLLSILGGRHQDRRKLRELGESYRQLVAATSFVPGAALLRGRTRWSGRDLPWAAIGIGLAVTILIVVFHPMIFGGLPLG